MNREIKFRVWELDFGMDYDPHPIESFNNLDKTSWMQYTGVKDKNGKEIYEGDILKHVDYNKIEVKDIRKFYFLCIFHHIMNSELEVIGNIHENPELI